MAALRLITSGVSLACQGFALKGFRAFRAYGLGPLGFTV